MGSPIILFGQTPQLAITAGVPAGPALFPTQNFVNPLTEPVEVHEFSLFSTVQVDADGGSASTNATRLLNNLLLSLRIGRHTICDLAPYTSLVPVRETDNSNTAILAGPINNVVTTRRWILTRPMTVRSQESFAGSISLDRLAAGLNGDGFVQMTVVARCRRLDGKKPPPTRYVPYASGSIFRTFGSFAPDQTYQNVFEGLLHVTSLTMFASQPISGFLNAGVATNPLRVIAPGGVANHQRRVLVDSVNTGGFFGQRNAMEVGHDLNPKDFYQISPYGSGAFDTGAVINIGMVGYREEIL